MSPQSGNWPQISNKPGTASVLKADAENLLKHAKSAKGGNTRKKCPHAKFVSFCESVIAYCDGVPEEPISPVAQSPASDKTKAAGFFGWIRALVGSRARTGVPAFNYKNSNCETLASNHVPSDQYDGINRSSVNHPEGLKDEHGKESDTSSATTLSQGLKGEGGDHYMENERPKVLYGYESERDNDTDGSPTSGPSKSRDIVDYEREDDVMGPPSTSATSKSQDSDCSDGCDGGAEVSGSNTSSSEPPSGGPGKMGKQPAEGNGRTTTSLPKKMKGSKRKRNEASKVEERAKGMASSWWRPRGGRSGA